MTSLLKRLENVDHFSKNIVYGWIRIQSNLLLPKMIIPTMIPSIVTLYYFNDETFDPHQTKKELLSKNNKILSLPKGTIVKQRNKLRTKGAQGLNQILLHDATSLSPWSRCEWQIGINQLPLKNIPATQSVTLSQPPAAIGLVVTEYATIYSGSKYIYGSNGTTLSGNTWWVSRDKGYGEGDIVSIILNIKEYTINFRVNGNDQDIGYKNICEEEQMCQLRLIILLNVIDAEIEILKFMKYK